MALLLKVNGDIEEVTPANGKTWTLKELQAFVGGYIEIAYARHRLVEDINEGYAIYDRQPGDMILILDEEGLLKEKSYNETATQLYDNISPIVGDVLYCKSEEVE